MWLTWILDNWRIALAGLASLLILMLYSWGVTMKMERDLAQSRLDAKIAEIESMRNAAKQYQEKSETTAKEIANAHAQQLVAAQETAVKNFKARYGAGNAACGLRTNGVLSTQHSDGQADSTGTPDGGPADPMADFARQCAETTVLYNEWRELARRNEFNISKD